MCCQIYRACPGQLHEPCDELTVQFLIFGVKIPGQEGTFHHGGLLGSLLPFFSIQKEVLLCGDWKCDATVF
jgi:hypothetical protein